MKCSGFRRGYPIQHTLIEGLCFSHMNGSTAQEKPSLLRCVEAFTIIHAGCALGHSGFGEKGSVYFGFRV